MVGEDWVKVKVVGVKLTTVLVVDAFCVTVILEFSVWVLELFVEIGKEQDADEPPLEPVQDQRYFVLLSSVSRKVPCSH